MLNTYIYRAIFCHSETLGDRHEQNFSQEKYQ